MSKARKPVLPVGVTIKCADDGKYWITTKDKRRIEFRTTHEEAVARAAELVEKGKL